MSFDSHGPQRALGSGIVSDFNSKGSGLAVGEQRNIRISPRCVSICFRYCSKHELHCDLRPLRHEIICVIASPGGRDINSQFYPPQ